MWESLYISCFISGEYPESFEIDSPAFFQDDATDYTIVFIHAYLLNLNFSNLCVYVWTNNQDILINSYVFLLMNDHKHIKRSV